MQCHYAIQFVMYILLQQNTKLEEFSSTKLEPFICAKKICKRILQSTQCACNTEGHYDVPVDYSYISPTSYLSSHTFKFQFCCFKVDFTLASRQHTLLFAVVWIHTINKCVDDHSQRRDREDNCILCKEEKCLVVHRKISDVYELRLSPCNTRNRYTGGNTTATTATFCRDIRTTIGLGKRKRPLARNCTVLLFGRKKSHSFFTLTSSSFANFGFLKRKTM